MYKLIFAFVAALSIVTFTACKKKGGADKTIEWADKACACKDQKCITDLQAEMKKFADENKSDAKPDPNAKVDPKIAEAAAKMGKCMTDIAMKAAGGGSDTGSAKTAGGDGDKKEEPKKEEPKKEEPKKEEPKKEEPKKEEPKKEEAKKPEGKKPDGKKEAGW